MSGIRLQPLWFVRDDPYISEDLGEALVGDATLGILNTDELDDAEYELALATADSGSRWPANYPMPVAALPGRQFAPDFWRFGAYDFASARLRNALAQSSDVVQFLPFDLLRASVSAKEQDYRWMRILPRQSAMDVSRSECEVVRYANQLTGKPGTYLRAIDRIALLDGLEPLTDIFRIDESPTFILASDLLAERVLGAGCTGVEFSDPANRLSGMRIDRIRTATGIAQRRIGFLD